MGRLLRSILVVGAFSLFINVLVLASPLYMLQVYDRVLTSRSLETLALLSLIALVALAAFSWLDSIRMQLMTRAALRLESAATGLVLRRSVAAASGSGPSYRHGLRDLRSIRNFLSSAGCVAFADIPWCPAFVALIWLFHPLMGYVAIGGVLLLLFLAWLDDQLSRGAVEAASEASRRAGDLADEAIRNADVVRALGMQHCVELRARVASHRAAEKFLAAGRYSSRVLALSKLVRQALQVVMLGLGAYLVIQQLMSPGGMIAATILLGRAMAPIEAAISGWRGMIEARGAARRVRALLADSSEASNMRLPAPTGEVSVEQAYFGGHRTPPILKNISFALKPGELLGLIGPSGAGKSMLGRMLVGILKPSAGSVRLDGAELGQWQADELGAHLGYLPQDVQLFEGTVAENIARLGDPAKEHDRIVEAAKLAGVHELVLSLPDGYNTLIGPRGHQLSSGQRQMVGLARALFGGPALIVLDEPNANLDGAGEDKLTQALNALKQRKATVVLITHRPAMLQAADKVLVLANGEIAQFGDRDTVINKFARVTSIQPAPTKRTQSPSATS